MNEEKNTVKMRTEGYVACERSPPRLNAKPSSQHQQKRPEGPILATLSTDYPQDLFTERTNLFWMGPLSRVLPIIVCLAFLSPRSMVSSLTIRAPTPSKECDASDWKAAVTDLVENGFALLELPSTSQSIPIAAFDSATQALDLLADAEDAFTVCQQVIEESADSAHATGYHRIGGMSARYNAHREGFVFSDGQSFHIEGIPSFETDCVQLEETLHDTANIVLDMLGRHLELPVGWFRDNLGPVRSHSQWHIKRYVDFDHNCTAKQETSTKLSIDTTYLPLHTDPSLISVVVLNHPGKQEGSAGLQYAINKSFVDVPWSGHSVAVVFVGSVLQHVTGGYFRACRHRVIRTATNAERMAATLFVRPSPFAILALPPSPVLHQSSCKVKGHFTFDQWNARVARNYEKAQARSAKVTKSNR